MYIRSKNGRRGWTLMEMMVAAAIFSVTAAAVGGTFLYSIRSMAALSNYTALDRMNQYAMDRITKEVRQSKMVASHTTNLFENIEADGKILEIVNADGNTVYYYFVGGGIDRLYRVVQTPTGDFSFEVMLEDCELLSFNLGQRNLHSNTWNYFPPTDGALQGTAKVVDLSWKTSRTLPHGITTSEDVQTAKIVIRKK